MRNLPNIKYDVMKKVEIEEVSLLIRELFDEFIGFDYRQKGKDTFLDYIDPENIKNRFDKENHQFIIAKDENKIIGIIEVRDFNHISLLFVDKSYHQQGIAKTLFQKVIAICLKHNPKLAEIEVNSSLYAAEIYKKLGFEKTDNRQEKDGIIYIPMRYKINNKKGE